MKKKILIIAFVLSSILINVFFVLSAVVNYNTLHNSGNWMNQKTKVARAVAGSASFMNTMPALFKFRLNLSKWQGYHELIFNRELNPEEISFNYKMDDKQYFVFFFNSDKEGKKYSGFRISNHERYPSIFFHTMDHRFIDKIKIPANEFDTKKLHIFKIKFLPESFTVFIDQKEIFTFQESVKANSFVGFRGGFADLRSDIDDFAITEKDGNKIFDSFFNWKLVPKLSFYTILFFCLYLSLAYFILKILLRLENIVVLKYIAYINFNLLLVALFVYVAMYSHIAKIYPTISKVYSGYPVIPTTEEVINQIRRTYADNKKNQTRVWFVGSSQTWGAGVYKEEDTFVRKIEKELQKNKPNLDCINGGVSGFTSKMALDLYKELFTKIKPDIVVINFSHNDAIFKVSLEEYIQNLKEIVELNRAHQVTTILSVEPVEIHFDEPEAHRNAMKDFALRENIPLIDMHTELASKYDEGFLWWDRVHLTSYGNSLFADIMFEYLNKIIR